MTNSRAIVLNTLKFGEQQLIVDMLTEELGRVSFICRIPKTQKGKLKKQFFQPLSLLDAVFDYRQNARLQHLRDVRLSQPFTSIPFDAGKLSISKMLPCSTMSSTASTGSTARRRRLRIFTWCS